LFSFCPNFHAQIFVSEGATMYGEKEIFYSKDTISTQIANLPVAKIYITSGVKIAGLDNDHLEMVVCVSSKIKKEDPKKASVLHIAKKESDKKLKSKVVAKKETSASYQHTLSSSKSETYFSFSKSFSKVLVPVSQFNPKPIINPENNTFFLVFLGNKRVTISYKNTETVFSQNKSSFSVRPPPLTS